MRSFFQVFVAIFVVASSVSQAEPGRAAASRAFADLVSPANRAAAADPYSELLALFDAPDAIAAPSEELREWWTGRCFAVDKKTVPLPGLLFTTYENDAGPLLPGAGTHRLFLSASHTLSATGYDSMSPSEKQAVLERHAALKSKSSQAKIVDNSLTATIYGEATPVVRSVRRVIRQSQTYYVSRMSVALDVTYEGVHYKAGDVWYACYHYAKVAFNKPDPQPVPPPVTPMPVYKTCECRCRAWIPAPVPTVGGYLKYEYGYSLLAHPRNRPGVSPLYYVFENHDEASCRRMEGKFCAGADRSQQGWPEFNGALFRCELSRG